MLVANENLREKVRIVLVSLGFITLFFSFIVGGATAHTYFKTPSWNAARDIIREVRTKHPGITQYLEQFDTCMGLGEYPTEESRLVCQHKGRMVAASEDQLRRILAYDNDLGNRLETTKLDYPPYSVMEEK